MTYITSSDQVKHPFSLTCVMCDAGGDIDTPEQAIEEGWTEIVEATDLAMANYMGLCPICRKEEELE